MEKQVKPFVLIPLLMIAVSLFLLFFEKPGIYSLGGNAGLFSMRLVGIKKVTSAP